MAALQIGAQVKFNSDVSAKIPGDKVLLSPVYGPPVPAIDATVKSAGQDVVLSAGAMQGVKAGFYFSIYRGAAFIGKVKVTRLDLLTCRCSVLFTKDGEKIQPGDSAATRLE